MQTLISEYRDLMQEYQLCRQLNIRYNFLERMAELYQSNKEALNNGSNGNKQLVQNQLVLERLLGIQDKYMVRCWEMKVRLNNPRLSYEDLCLIHSLLLDFEYKGYDKFSDDVMKVRIKIERKLKYYKEKLRWENERKI